MSGFDLMMKRLHFDGGDADGRIVKNKLRSMQYAMWHSYQGEWITFKERRHRCLINPEKLTVDYEQKEISIEYDAGMQSGDTFYWDRTGLHWIVYTQFHEEEAYFRARIRECDYEVEVNGKPYWVWLRGPVETATVWRQKHQTEFNDLNYSLLIYIKDNEDTREFFKRHQVVKIDGDTWKVAATDKFSQTPGIIEVYLEEAGNNEMLDKMIVPEVVKVVEPGAAYIDGPQEVNVYDTDLSFSIVDDSDGSFVVNSSKVKITSMDSNSCVIDILTGKTGSFEVIYRKEGQKDIILPVKINSF